MIRASDSHSSIRPWRGWAAGREAVIPILQAIQAHYRYLPPEALERVCELTEITPAAIAGVSTFYTQFRHQPVGRHIDPRLPRHGLPRERGRGGPGRLPAPPADRRRRRYRRRRAVHRRESGLPGLLHAGPGDADRRRHLRRHRPRIAWPRCSTISRSSTPSGAPRRGARRRRRRSRWARSASAWAPAASPREAARCIRPSSGRLPQAARRPWSRRWAASACAIKRRWSSWSPAGGPHAAVRQGRCRRAPRRSCCAQFKPQGHRAAGRLHASRAGSTAC